MAQNQLTAAAVCAALLTVGAVAEIAAPGPTGLLTAADYAVGAGYAVSGAWLWAAERGLSVLSLATAATWFAGTLAIAVPGLPGYGGDVAVLAYRGVLVHLFVRALGERRPAGLSRVLIAAGYLAILLPAPADALAGAAVMTAVAAVTAQAARHAPADRRAALTTAALAAAVVAAAWWLAAGGATGAGVQLANDAALLTAAVLLVLRSDPGARLYGAINALVVELGPSRRPGAPVSALLADALADPQLEVRYTVPGMGWFDEQGNPVGHPPADDGTDTGRVTKAAAPGGGQVALVHGPVRGAGPALAQAAAQAAALALDSARLSAEVRQQAIAVRESRRWLLTVADTERQDLEARLRAGPVGRLQHVSETLAGLDGQTAANARTQLAGALDDLTRLAHGLFPGALGTQPIEEVLRELAEGMPMIVHLVTGGPLQNLHDGQRALAFFFCSECLANVALHAGATTATLELRLDGSNLLISVLDDGHGGASMTTARGLRGLADRVEVAGGRLTITSPPGGPTRIRAEVPLA
jgi:signal transduction histidine kinase